MSPLVKILLVCTAAGMKTKENCYAKNKQFTMKWHLNMTYAKKLQKNNLIMPAENPLSIEYKYLEIIYMCIYIYP